MGIKVSDIQDCGNTEGKDKRLVDNEIALGFILGGNSEFIAVSGRTSKRIVYRIKQVDNTLDSKTKYVFFLNTAIGNEIVYAGLILLDRSMNKFKFIRGKAGKLPAEHVNVRSILYIINNLYKHNTLLNVKIFHVGKCGRCGRKLTTNESLKSGICAECKKL